MVADRRIAAAGAGGGGDRLATDIDENTIATDGRAFSFNGVAGSIQRSPGVGYRPGPSVTVPDIVGMARSRATCELQRAGLRWRFDAGGCAFAKPIPSCERQREGAVTPDPRVREQRPAAGRRVRRGAVVRIRDMCTELPEGRACA